MSKYDVGLDRKRLDPLNLMLDYMKPGSRVLEFGCSSGRMTRYMKEYMNCRVYIVERDREDFEKASEFSEDGICGDIMQMLWLERFKNISFDYIIFADVLEHLSDPVKILSEAVSLLDNNGQILISVPNIAHNDILLNLYGNRFKYTSTGLLDNTHIHFFTYENLVELCSEAGLEIVYRDCICVPTNLTEQSLYHTIEENDFLELISERKNGDIYQYVIGAVQRVTHSAKKIEKTDNINERIGTVFRKAYFDLDGKFSNDHAIERYSTQKEVAFSEKFDIPNGTKRIRFDPALRMPCVITNLRIYTDKGEIPANLCEVNAETFQGSLFFKTFDAQIVVKVDTEINWIVFEGEVTYSYDILSEEHSRYRSLRKKVNDLEKVNEQFRYVRQQVDDMKKELSIISQQKDQYLFDLKQEKTFRINEKETYNKELNELLKQKEQYLSALKQEKLHRICETEKNIEKINLLDAQNRNCKKELTEKEDTLEKYAKMVEDLKNSISWKVTAPLRKIRKLTVGNKITSVSELEEISFNGDLQKDNIEALPISSELLWDFDYINEHDNTPLVSVIVPNYNHALYLRERLESIYNQTYANIEVILLDDCSTDNSREILDEYADAYKEKTTRAYNTENCGKPFKQWDKGISYAKGELIWIAESDDYCESNFLEEMVDLFKRESVMLAFARSVFIQDGQKVWSTEEYLNDLSALKWDKPFTMTAHNLVNAGFAVKNLIPNVSSAVFRNVGKFTEEKEPLWGQMKLCGDWVFYLNLIKGGCVSYTNKTTNYYRIHQQSTSLNVQKTDVYYKEQCEVSKYIVRNYKVDVQIFGRVLNNLKEHYKAIRQVADGEAVENYYCIEEIEAEQMKREPNILMCCYSMVMGGGETYPLFLANEMKKEGLSVTLLDFRMGEYDKRVRSLLSKNVPLVEIGSLDNFYQIVTQLGGEVLHSHHASVDSAIADWKNANAGLRCKHVVSLHGMYEAISQEDCKATLERVVKSCAQFIYTADKNLESLYKYGYSESVKLQKLPNGLPFKKVCAKSRAELGISDNDFVLCLVSRALPEKGWEEAIEAVERANSMSDRTIHLIMIGEGEMYDRHKNMDGTYIHLLGSKTNIREYFAMSDVGFLPTRYPGESYPLVVIDSLMCGKPVIATDLGEIRNQLLTSNGEIAGILLHLSNWKLSVNEICDAIITLASNEDMYHEMVLRAKDASIKFDIEDVCKKYLTIYTNVKKE